MMILRSQSISYFNISLLSGLRVTRTATT